MSVSGLYHHYPQQYSLQLCIYHPSLRFSLHPYLDLMWFGWSTPMSHLLPNLCVAPFPIALPQPDTMVPTSTKALPHLQPLQLMKWATPFKMLPLCIFRGAINTPQQQIVCKHIWQQQPIVTNPLLTTLVVPCPLPVHNPKVTGTLFMFVEQIYSTMEKSFHPSMARALWYHLPWIITTATWLLPPAQQLPHHCAGNKLVFHSLVPQCHHHIIVLMTNHWQS